MSPEKTCYIDLKTLDRNRTDPEICFKLLPIKVPYVSIEN